MKITQVELQKKNPHRYNVYLDGEFAFGVDEDLVVNRRLIVGKDITQEDLGKILFEAEVGKLMERMYALFNRRQRTEKEVRDYLKTLSFKRKIKGEEEITEVVIEQVVENLKKKELLNDRIFAEEWARVRRDNKKKGKRAIQIELIQKGIDRETINEVLQSTVDEASVAFDALSRKARAWNNLDRLTFKKKALGFLVRRGFDYGVASDAIDKYFKKDYN